MTQWFQGCLILVTGMVDRGQSIRFKPKENGPMHGISNNVVCVTSKGSDQPAHMCSLIRAFARRLNILRVFSY